MAKNDEMVTISILDRTLEKQTDKILTEVGDIINDFAVQVDERFSTLEASLEKLTVTLDHFLKRLDNIEADNAARDAQLARHDRWLHQMAEKTGLELKH